MGARVGVLLSRLLLQHCLCGTNESQHTEDSPAPIQYREPGGRYRDLRRQAKFLEPRPIGTIVSFQVTATRQAREDLTRKV